MPHTSNNPPSFLRPDDLRKIVKKHLPAWLRACSADADTIVMHEEAFDTSGDDLFLLGCALKYAAQAGKSVHVASGGKGATARPTLRAVSFEAVYREAVDNTGDQAKTGHRKARRHAPRET